MPAAPAPAARWCCGVAWTAVPSTIRQDPTARSAASSNLEWVESPGKGKVYTYVITRQPVNPAFRERLPWGVVEVELEEAGPPYQQSGGL